jgi:hypothetical protein
MRRLFILLCLIGAVAAGGLAAHANEFRFPKTGKHAFRVTLLKGWRTKIDTRGGLLLVPPPPSQRAMIYIAILVDDKFRDQPDSAVAAEVAKLAGIQHIDSQSPARISDLKGTAFYGKIAKKQRFARTAKIVIVRLAPNTWAEEWIVTQPGIGPAERDALNQAISQLTLTTE